MRTRSAAAKHRHHGRSGIVLFALIKLIGSSSSASTQEATGIRASSRQGTIKLLVDGKLIGTLPQEVKGMSPGEHTIVFDAGERYAQQRRMVELIPAEMKELEPVTLKVTKGSAIFDVKTPGAQLALVHERRELTDYSHAIDVDNTRAGLKPGRLQTMAPQSRSRSAPNAPSPCSSANRAVSTCWRSRRPTSRSPKSRRPRRPSPTSRPRRRRSGPRVAAEEHAMPKPRRHR
jgi:hypothetical protein